MDLREVGLALAGNKILDMLPHLAKYERIDASSGTLIVGRVGMCVMEIVVEAENGTGRVDAHTHSTQEEAEECYLYVREQALQLAKEFNDFTSQAVGRELIAINGSTPDHFPGEWTAV